MELTYEAVPTIAQVHQDTNKYLFIRGPVGSGKSSGAIWHIVLNAFKQHPQFDGVRRSRYGIVRASYPALKSTVIKSWKQWFKNLIEITYDTPIRGLMKIPHPDGHTVCEIELVFLALDREEDVHKLQSLELTAAHFNETAEIPRGVHQMAKSRVNRYPAMVDGGAIDPFIVCDYNSVDTEHWLYKIAEEEHPPQHSFYVQPPALHMVAPGDDDPDNPIIDIAGNHYVVNPGADNIKNLSEDYYSDQVFGAEPDWVNVLILNNYGQVRHGRPVYPEYQDKIHCASKLLKPIKGLSLIIGMDCGLSPAAAFTQLSPEGTLLLLDEVVTEDCSVQKFLEDYLVPHIANYYSKFNFELIIDPTGGVTRSQNDAKTVAQMVKQAGLPFRLATTNNMLKRREAVVFFLRKLNGFLMSPQCPTLRKGFISEYKFDKKRSGDLNNVQFKEKPEKNHYSHVHDAAQYAALEHSEGRVARRMRRPRRRRPASDHIGDASAGY